MEILEHLFVPGCKDCEEKEILQAVGIIGALISPHNLYVHSALVKVNWRSYREKNSIFIQSVLFDWKIFYTEIKSKCSYSLHLLLSLVFENFLIVC